MAKTSTEKRLLPRVEALADALLGENLTGQELGLFRAGAAMVALNVAGIPATLQQANVVLDPEQWTRPHALLALKIRGVVYGGDGRYGWEAIAEAFRAGRDEKDAHYLDISKSSMISVDQITALNPGRLNEWEAEVQRARDIVTQTEPGLRVARAKP